jgi:ABC-2 type transport system permease protein
MSRTWPVVKREFLEMIRTRSFLIGTLLGPLFMVGGIAFQIYVATKTVGGERTIVVVDESAHGLGEIFARQLTAAPANGGGARSPEIGTRFTIEIVGLDGRGADTLRAELLERVERGEVDGFLWFPAGVLAGDTVSYEGKNAASIIDMEQVRGAVQTAVQGLRLTAAGIAEAEAMAALERVTFTARKTGDRAASGTANALMVLAYIMGFAVYVVVILYGNAVLRGVLEEKRDRIVEAVVSSIRPDQPLIGKVLGIGGAGILQILIWVPFAALALTSGAALAMQSGVPLPELPSVPLGVGLIFVSFFAMGFVLYATMYAVVGSIATSDQEAQQLQMPIIVFLVLGISTMGPILMDPNGFAAVLGSLIPLTAPIAIPMRAVVTGIPALELISSIALVLLTIIGLLWVSARIYRIGILATGKRPSAREVWKWVRTG